MPSKRDDDLERELRADLELEEEEQRERGLSPEEAHFAALRAFGNPTTVREQIREQTSGEHSPMANQPELCGNPPAVHSGRSLIGGSLSSVTRSLG